MKVLSILPLLAATALATESSTPPAGSETISSYSSASSSYSSSASSSASSSSSAASSSSSEVPEPTPLGQIWKPKWAPGELDISYTTHCRTTSTYTANIYNLGEMYPNLKDFAPQLKVFYHRQHYPGSWDGVDDHGNERDLLKMEFEELPFAVREWLQRNEKQRFFSVQEGVVFFAPGALYSQLPLWVEGDAGEELGECEGVFDDLENYFAEPKDGAVIARLEHKSVGKNLVEFTVEAMLVKEKKAGKGAAAKESEHKKDEL